MSKMPDPRMAAPAKYGKALKQRKRAIRAEDEANRLRAVIAEMVRLLNSDAENRWMEAMMIGSAALRDGEVRP